MVIVSIVILNYNGKQYLNDCLKSVFDITFPEPDELEVILVDNASQDGSVEFIKNNFPQVKLIYSNKNLGFAGGNNLGIKAASGKYIALLNNDTVITKEWLKGPVEIIETDSKIGIVGSKMLFLNEPGRLNNAGSYLTIDGEGGDIGFREKDTGQYDQIREVFSVCAGSCIIKREVFEQIGYFDESFFAYYEDTDLCYRAHWAGWKCFFCPDSIVFHKHCGVLGEWSPLFIFLVYRNKLFMHFKNSQLRFFARVFIKYFMSVIKDIVILRVNGKVHLKIFLSLIKNLPVLLYKRIRIRSKRTVPDATISRLLSLQPVRKDKKLLCEIKKIGIYNPSLPVMGGGENHMAVLIEEFEKLFPEAHVDIIVHNMKHYVKIDDLNYPTVNDLEKNFGVTLKKTHIKKVNLKYQKIFETKFISGRMFLSALINNRLLSNITRGYDIFVNFCYQSVMPARGKINFYFCMFPPKCYKINGKTIRGKIQRFIIDLTGTFSDTYNVFLSNSNYTRKYVEKYLSAQSAVLYPSVNLLSSDKKLNYDNKKNYIISIGRFFINGHNKKQDVLIEAFKKLYDSISSEKDIQLFLVGRQDQSYKSQIYIKKLLELAKGYPIKFEFSLSKSSLEELLSKSKIYWHATGFGEDLDLHPDKAEHFGITTIEAMSYGVIPIVINKGGQPELVIQGHNGFLWNTIEEMIDYTKNILFNNQERVIEMSRNAANFAEKFSRQSHNRELKKILFEFIEF